MSNVRNLKKLYKTLFWDCFSMVAGVLCFQSAKLRKAVDFNKESMGQDR